MTDRDLILSALPGGHPTPAPQIEVAFAPITDPWTEFQLHLESLGGRLITEAEYNTHLQKPRWCDPILGLPNTAPSIWDAEVGVSRAIGAIAKSGTLIFESGPETERLSTLIPPLNLVLVDRSSILPTLQEALAKIGPRATVFVTGPSRTADIEGVMVRGVHGPGQLLVHVRDA